MIKNKVQKDFNFNLNRKIYKKTKQINCIKDELNFN